MKTINNKTNKELSNRESDIDELRVSQLKITLNKKDKVIFDGYAFIGMTRMAKNVYLELCSNYDTKTWIDAHNNMFEYFEGVFPKIAVVSTPLSPSTKEAYRGMVAHHGITISQIDERTPLGKAIFLLQSHCIGTLQTVFNGDSCKGFETVEDFKELIEIIMEEDNKNKPKGMLPLPNQKYVYKNSVRRKVQFNNHIQIDSNYYSVPSEYIGKDVRVIISNTHIYIHNYEGHHICKHTIKQGRNKYSTVKQHLKKKVDKTNWNGNRFREWASNVGPATLAVVDKLLKYYSVEEQGYKSVLAVLTLTNKYSEKDVEAACEKSLLQTEVPRFRNIEAVIQTGQVVINNA